MIRTLLSLATAAALMLPGAALAADPPPASVRYADGSVSPCLDCSAGGGVTSTEGKGHGAPEKTAPVAPPTGTSVSYGVS